MSKLCMFRVWPSVPIPGPGYFDVIGSSMDLREDGYLEIFGVGEDEDELVAAFSPGSYSRVLKVASPEEKKP